MSYKKLEIWKLAHTLVIDIHKMTLENLPKFEMYEEGSQIRRSSKSTKSLIVEGYGRRVYKQDFIRFLMNSLASNDEAIDHLENLFETGSFKNQQLYQNLHERLNILGKKINSFISSVKQQHQPPSTYSVKENEADYLNMSDFDDNIQ